MHGSKVSIYTPRHLRRKAMAKKSGGALDSAKKQAFRRCKRISDQFIHQSASALESNGQYLSYCAATEKGTGFRKG